MVDGHNESMATISNFYCPYILINSSKAQKWNVVVSQRIKIHCVATYGKEEKSGLPYKPLSLGVLMDLFLIWIYSLPGLHLACQFSHTTPLSSIWP